jgi:diphthamide synthase (EF-2-diphthine--ammonia ligase)
LDYRFGRWTFHFRATNADYESRMAAVCSRASAEGLYGIAFGDLFLEDIRAYRIEKLAGTGLEPVFPVWCADLGITTADLAREMIAAGLRAHLTCIDPRSLNPSFAGRTFDASLLADLPSGVDPCGERGEFHSFAFAGPIFTRTLSVLPGETVERDNFIYADLLPTPANHTRNRSNGLVADRQVGRAFDLSFLPAADGLSAPLSAQMMARPGLAGTRASTDTWWSHAVFYQIAGT